MCNNNLSNIFSVDFTQVSDEINWFSNSANPLSTTNNKLVLIPNAINDIFSRSIGVIDISKNRINVKLNLEVFRPTTGGSNITEVLVQVLNGTNVIGQNTIHIDNIGTSETVKYYFDRTYKYDNISGNISLKFKVLQGLQNEVRFYNLYVDNFFYCQENVRTYFVIDSLLEDSLLSQSSGIKLNSFKVDDIETLTPDFFAYNSLNLGNSVNPNWNYSKANLDGTNRTSNITAPNTFNPFVDELGLVYDIINSFHGGKPIGTFSNQDFGIGIMNLGFDKPIILNGLLQEKKGCFFIDIDFTKNLYIEFDILINNNSSSVYNSPSLYRKYFIIWDKETCIKKFYYSDQLLNQTISDQLVNGFLAGITPEERELDSLGCSQTVNYTGASGVFEYIIDFGTNIGMCGINYNAYNVPDRFEILWDTIHVDTGYVGNAAYNQQLINNGISINDINTTGVGTGQLMFYKSSAYPTTAIVKISAVLQGTGWTFSGICPTPTTQPINIVWNDTNTVEDRSGLDLQQAIKYLGSLLGFSNYVWQKDTGSGFVDIQPILNITTIFSLTAGINKFRIKALDSNNVLVYSNILFYDKQTVQPSICNEYTVNPPTNTQQAFISYTACDDNITGASISQGDAPFTICAKNIIQDDEGVATINGNTCNSFNCQQYSLAHPAVSGESAFVDYKDCNGVTQTLNVLWGAGQYTNFCASEILTTDGIVSLSGLPC